MRWWFFGILLLMLGCFSYFIRAGDVDSVTTVEPFVVEINGSLSYVFPFQRLETGKNRVTFPFSPGLDARQFLQEMPDIDAITSLEENSAYIRAFGGIGKNFILEANKSYEVSVVRSANYTARIP